MSHGRVGAGGSLLALAALIALSGCGSSGDFASKIGGIGATVTTTTTAETTTSEDRELSPAAAARFVGLRADDFPYLEEEPAEEGGSSDEGRNQRQFEKCAGDAQMGGELASAESPSFGGLLGAQYLDFNSNVGVFASPEDAHGVIDLLRDPHVYSCFGRLVKPTLERDEAGTDVELVSVATRRLSLRGPAFPESFGFRIRATVAEAPESRQLTSYLPGETDDGRAVLNFYMDVLVFVEGRIEVDLTSSGSPRPVPPGLKRNLLRLLRTRAEEAGQRLPGSAPGR